MQLISGRSTVQSGEGPAAGEPRPRVPVPLAVPPPPAPRADAARNRRRVLEAAAALFAERGVAAVTMDDVVAAAGVGKGTLYRSFGDKSGLAAALLDERERQLQAGILHGRAPLGPGAPASGRLEAFVRAYLAYVAENLELVWMSQAATAGARLRIGSHRFWRAHLAFLLAGAGAADPGLRADILLAALAAEQVAWWIREERRPVGELADRLAAAAAALCT
jgi:AcrR family transcriptional regulator